MTAARLSPAASLLRNSKLFALPPAIPLPPLEPSSEPIPRSNTATTIYPTRAAIETTSASLFRGDWGLKRPLPLKSTVKSRAVRLNNGIDTREHIADFDSAADHVLTLKKFQQLNQAIQYPQLDSNYDRTAGSEGAFRRDSDNTTSNSTSAPFNTVFTGVWPNIDPSVVQRQLPDAVRRKDNRSDAVGYSDKTLQRAPKTVNPRREVLGQPRRWRYDGPSLVQMQGHEFDEYLKTLDSGKRRAFRDRVRQFMDTEKADAERTAAREEGKMGEGGSSSSQASDEEVTEYIRQLRQKPKKFGPLITQFLDLPEGPPSGRRETDSPAWEYGRDTLASEYYQEAGPPRTHPSAGLSYIQSSRFAENDALFGPRQYKDPVIGRVLKVKQRGIRATGNFGVAGFVVKSPNHNVRGAVDIPPFEPKAGGNKIVLRTTDAEVSEQGALIMTTKAAAGYVNQDDEALSIVLQREPEKPARDTPEPARIMARLDTEKYRRREATQPSQDVGDILKEMTESLNRSGQ